MAFTPGWAQDEMQYNLGVVTVRDCCGNLYVTDDDEKIIRFWDILYDDINNNANRLADNEVFGRVDECMAENVMDAHHLLLFLQFIQRERESDAVQSTTGFDLGNEYYMLEYCTKAIRERFICKGYSIQAILQVFQLFELDDPTAGGGLTDPLEDGIGRMIIESETDPIFRVS